MQMDGITSRSAAARSLCIALVVVSAVAASSAVASSLEQAKRIHDRLAGVPPSAGVLSQMQLAVSNTGGCGISLTGGCTPIGAAYLAMENPAFYNATLKNWITPWTNRDSNKFAPLNDYTATVIGIIRDADDYRKILYDNVLYVGAPGVVPDNYSTTDNNHYAELESNNVPLGDSAKLVRTTQTYLPAGKQAGVITSRAAARAFFIDGTNRAMFRFTLKNHLCKDLEDVMDTSRPTDRIRRDISRSPGGDSRIFMNTCVGCHSGMDPMAQAFAFYNFQYTKDDEDHGFLTYHAAADTAHDPSDMSKSATPAGTESKYHINEDHFPEGFETETEQWDNYWRSGPNTAIFGWAVGGGSGQGAASMLQEFSNSEAFAVCSVKKVFKVVCLRDPGSVNGDQAAFTSMLSNFKSNHYNLKHTFAEAAVYCAGH